MQLLDKRITIERNIKQSINSKKYYVTLYYSSENNKKIRETKAVNTLTEARDLRDKHEAAIKLKLKSQPNKKVTLEYCIKEFIEISNLADTTIYAYNNIKKHISTHYIYKKHINKIIKNDILSYIKHIKSTAKLSDITINKHLIFLQSVFKNAYQNDFVSNNIFEKINKLKIDNKFQGDFYTKEECINLLKLLEKNNDFRISVPVYLALFLGLRRGEICGLQWTDIDLLNKTINIQHSRTQAGKQFITKQPKTPNSIRSLSFDSNIQMLLNKYMHEQHKNQNFLGNEYETTNYVLVDSFGKPIRPNYISDLWKDFLNKYNLRHIRFHDLRHTFVSLAYQNNISILSISKAVGHSSTKTTENIYTHLKENNNDEVIKSISNLLKEED